MLMDKADEWCIAGRCMRMCSFRSEEQALWWASLPHSRASLERALRQPRASACVSSDFM
jgi:hypothetical protein